MKIFVILGVLFAYAQATSEPVTVQQMQVRALNTCVQEKNLDADEIKVIMKHDILPVENAEFADFFACYWKKAGVIKDDGTFDDLFIKVTYPRLIKEKYPSVTDTDAEHLTASATEHCKDAAKADSIGLKGIQYRNCMMQYVIDSQA